MSNEGNQPTAINFINAVLWSFALLFTGIVAYAFIFADSYPEPVKEARNTLELHYINHDIYYPVRCRVNELEADTIYFVLCSPVSAEGVGGGLFALEINDQATIIHPVNGKAIQHSEGLRVGSVLRGVDIPAILERF